MGAMAWWGSEQLVLCSDPDLGLRAVIAVDDTTLGPGLGGVRYRRYPTEEAGVRECQRLAAAMTRKNAIAELPYGGAKSVIFDTGPVADRPALMRRFGAFVARTGGAYLPGVDMGTAVEDLRAMADGGAVVSCSRRDPSPVTAAGVHLAIRAAVAHARDGDGLDGVRVLVQGAGHVGAALARLLASEDAHVLVADVDTPRAMALARETGGKVLAPERALDTPCDVFAPCAVARIISPETIDRLRCRIVCGAANDTLANRACADALAARDILYVPDFVANAGGVIDIHALRMGWDEDRLGDELDRIGERVTGILADADHEGATPLDVAEARAARRIREGAALALAA
jgi:leucine dehydrogenase